LKNRLVTGGDPVVVRGGGLLGLAWSESFSSSIVVGDLSWSWNWSWQADVGDDGDGDGERDGTGMGSFRCWKMEMKVKDERAKALSCKFGVLVLLPFWNLVLGPKAAHKEVKIGWIGLVSRVSLLSL
jgi:hypothetical protein